MKASQSSRKKISSRKKSPVSLPVVVIGSDHGAYKTKQAVRKVLANAGYTIVDLGGFTDATPDDYPDIAAVVAKEVASDSSGETKGILLCGSGTGMAIAANKIRGIRAAVAYDSYSAKMARYDNDANVLALRGRKFSSAAAAKLALLFLRTPFSRIARHAKRVKKISALERTR